nr:retrotransposon Orf1 [Tanacetum cinerariifolium]
MFNEGNTKAQSIRNPRINLAHRCITMTITSRKETTNRVTKIDLFYLYCIFGEGVVCNIPYWLSKYLKIVRDKSVIFDGMFVTRITQSFGLLTNEKVMMRKGMEKGGNRGVGGSANIYRNMSQGDYHVRQERWMDQQDERQGRINAWMGQQDKRAHWIYDHTVRQFQHMSTRDNLEPHLLISPFSWFEANNFPYGYQGHMPPGYTYRPYPPQDGSS